MRTLDVAIVGYGIAGISAAIELRRQGHRITHFEQSPGAAPGAGLLLHPPALRQLHRLGILDAALAAGSVVTRICARTVRGRPIMNFSYADGAAGLFGLGIRRETLQRLLSGEDTGRNQLLGGRKIVSLDPQRGYLFEEPNVRHGPYDLVVVATGIRSLLREAMSIPVRYSRTPDSAALVGVLDDPHGLAADRLIQYFDGGRHLSVWPIGRGCTDGATQCSLGMNVSHAEADDLRQPAAWRTLVARLCPPLGPLIDDRATDVALHIFKYRDVELERYAVGRTVLIGDAAHSMSPQLGSGAQLAIEDAAALATAIGQHHDVFSALDAYARMRLPRLRHYHRVSRWLTPVFQSDSRALAAFRDRLFARAMRLPPARRLAQSLFC